MDFMTTIPLTHAVFNSTVYVRVLGIGSYMYMPTVKNTHVCTIAGIVPVTESPEKIKELLTQLEKGDTNANAHSKHE